MSDKTSPRGSPGLAAITEQPVLDLLPVCRIRALARSYGFAFTNVYGLLGAAGTGFPEVPRYARACSQFLG